MRDADPRVEHVNNRSGARDARIVVLVVKANAAVDSVDAPGRPFLDRARRGVVLGRKFDDAVGIDGAHVWVEHHLFQGGFIQLRGGGMGCQLGRLRCGAAQGGADTSAAVMAFSDLR